MSRFAPIAIVGQACLLPGARSPAELWAGLLARRDFLGRATAKTWEVDDPTRLRRTDPSAPPAERIPTDRGGYVTDFPGVPAGLALEPDLVATLDPLVQWLLRVGAEALADAGIDASRPIAGGAIVGNLSYPTYGLETYALARWAEAFTGRETARPSAGAAINRFVSGLPATLLTEGLRLQRGGFMLDAACASSLYAIKYACDWLQTGRADVMLAGGASRVHGLTIHAGFTTLQALSPTGRSRPLDANGDGLVPSEGAALVVLKRLDDARRDGSRILGVIRGIGLANDGRGSGLLVPSSAGQVRAMTAAYRMSGLRPEEIDLVECHATGTPVGDAAEIRSCREIFGSSRRVALGSLKSNLGHLLPTAGVAGLIKVLQSMAHGVLPPLRALDTPHPALAGSALQPCTAAAEWESRGLRRAAINAFGFGGNNAHLLVEQAPAAATVSVPAPVRPPRDACAIVGVAVRLGDGRDVNDFLRHQFGRDQAAARGPMRHIRLPLEGSAFPPRDLGHALPQQLLALELAHQSIAQVRSLPAASTGVYVGMGCDAEACRFGLNLRLPEFLRAAGVPAAEPVIAAARQAIQPGPFAATTLGFMPNVVANRINRQFDCGGPSCAVSGEELSGLFGLEIAVRALTEGDIDAALVGAVDLSEEPVHRAASEGKAADGGCMLVLKRRADAERDGDTIYALIGADPAARVPGAVDWTSASESLESSAGRVHAAAALLEVASAALALKHRRRPPAAGSTSTPWEEAEQPRGVRVEAAGLREQIGVVFLQECTTQPPLAWPPAPPPSAVTGNAGMEFPAHFRPVAEILKQHFTASPPAGVEIMPPAPRLQPVRITPATNGGDVSPPAEAFVFQEAGAVTAASSEPNEIVALHEIFLEEMAAAHAAFLRAGAALPGGAFEPAEAESATLQPAILPEPVAERAPEPALVPPPVSAPPPVPAAEVTVVGDAAPVPRGPQFSYEQLLTLASGKISEVFGASFAGQDAFHRQVRMPMPPMLLAHRVTGIDAPAHRIGPGTIWTETDVRPDAWYLHHGRVPLGITIESGQADLLLISWMGVDLENRSERVYRLLGCEATVKGPLPKIGDKLQFDIHIEGHARFGGIRMFFFRSDLRIDGEVRLSVRHGQAGFFSDQELADSEGVLWDPATEAAPALRQGRHDRPSVSVAVRAYSSAEVRAFAEGRMADCFGPTHALASTHTRTPGIPAGRMQFIDEVTAFDPAGGPWGRGYLRTRTAITPDLWFFEGHFKNDPCMPGTLMLEGAVQALAFYLTAVGATLARDGWRFEPVKNETITLRCRGQCVPTSRELTFEVFIEQYIDGPAPQLRATILGSVDGHKALLCQGMTLELVPDWPLEEMLRRGEVRVSTAGQAWSRDGFAYDHRSLLACALGRPSESFGPSFRSLDGPLRNPRLPRPPYHFMTRIVDCVGELGSARAGLRMECDYDFAAGDWYFARNASPTMPACVFMEALLQPCGWLSSYGRDIRGQADDVFFRNLDGTLIWHRELPAAAGTLRVRTELTRWSALGTMIIVAFRVEARSAGELVAEMDTAFGFFPGDAFANQAGLPPAAGEAERFTAAGDFRLELRGETSPAFSFPGAALAGDPLLMLDRLTGWWPEAGAAGLGVVRAEKDVRAEDWFFQAHFMNDPVQPGSLGIEALLQLLQAAMRLRGIGAELAHPRFEPVALAEPLTWRYRGQVVPANRLITTLVELTAVETAADGSLLARARGSLWVDGKKIYDAPKLAMRVRAGPPPATGAERVFSLRRDPWLHDHRPTFTAAVVPLTAMLDTVAASAAAARCGDRLVAIGAFTPRRWLACADDGEVRVRVEWGLATPSGEQAATLLAWRQAPRAELSRFDEIGETTLTWAPTWPAPPAPLDLLDAPAMPSPYATGETTHGPAFQLLRGCRRSREGASASFAAAAGAVPVGLIHPALLDGCTHVVPLSRLQEWYPALDARWNGLPRGILGARFFGPTPRSGEVRVEIRPQGCDDVTGSPRAYVQFIAEGRVWCDLTIEFALLDAGPFAGVDFATRRAFLRERRPAPIRFSAAEGAASVWSADGAARAQWMPRQLETLFNLGEMAGPAALAEAVTAREHVAAGAGLHPAEVAYDAAAQAATTETLPLQLFPLRVERNDGRVRVTSATASLLKPGSDGGLFQGPLLNDVIRALTQRYVRHFRLEDAAALAAVRGRPLILCSNHQTALESLVFTELLARWSGLPMTTVTRLEHRDSWMGRLNDLLWRHPRRAVAVNPQLLFDRARPELLLALFDEFRRAQPDRPHSLHLHVEGEQGLSCRERVRRMSAVVVDLALDLGAPIVPVRFSGGLPVEPLPGIISFPHGYGRQDYTLGRPLLAADLRAVPRPRAAELVIDAINRVAPLPEQEQPLPPDPELARRIAALQAAHGISEVQAGFIAALQDLPDPSDVTRAMLDFPARGAAALPVSPDERLWHTEVATWLWGREADRHREAEQWKETARVRG